MIEVANCNNIRVGKIRIIPGHLNIKFGVNGTGKSTIAKAIAAKASASPLYGLIPFGTSEAPKVILPNGISTILVFDENFVNDVVFVESEAILNAFEVFIKVPGYDLKLATVNQMLSNLKVGIGNDPDFIGFREAITVICDKLGLKQNGEVKQSVHVKSLKAPQNIFNVPAILSKYKPFIQNSENINWIAWRHKGFEYDNIQGCPFCAESLNEHYEAEKVTFSESYKKSVCQNLVNMMDHLDTLSAFMNSEKYLAIRQYVVTGDVENPNFEMLLQKLASEAECIKKIISRIIDFDSTALGGNEISKLESLIGLMKVSIPNFEILSSEKSLLLYRKINDQIDQMIQQITPLKAALGSLNGFIIAASRSAAKDINEFLLSAGINYKFLIHTAKEGQASATLQYIGSDDKLTQVSGIKNHLSWGERNAFALALFVYYAKQKNPDLIILDDPISSFDSNKKYAIINRLFFNRNDGKTLYGMTTMMLTHDFEPVIDFIINSKPTGGYTKASFLKNKNGLLDEVSIDENDIKSVFHQMLEYANNQSLCLVNRLAFYRRFLEHSGRKEGLAYNIVSSLQHGRPEPKKLVDGIEYSLSPDEHLEGIKEIRNVISDFDYNKSFSEFYQKSTLKEFYNSTQNSYLKMQIFRAYIEISGIRDRVKDNVLVKYIDETYHVENDYVYFLDAMKYDVIPSYIINSCNEFMAKE